MRFVLLLSVVVALSCGQLPVNPEDAGADDGGASTDAGADAGLGTPDAGAQDAGLVDAGLADAGALDAGPLDAGLRDGGLFTAVIVGGCPQPQGGSPYRLRAVAANLTSGNYQNYDPGHGQRILQGLQPDIVMIQEFSYGTSTPPELRGFVDATFDGGFAYHRGNGQIPNGVISRWPIVAQGMWVDPQVGNRDFTWALVDLPGPNDVFVVSVHLLTSNAGERNLEAQALMARLQAFVPAGHHLLLGGDFNTNSRSENAYSTFSDLFTVTGPHPEDQDGVEGTNRNRDKPYDGVYASDCLAAEQVPVLIGANAFPGGFVADTRVYSPIEDLAPALTSDSNATNMQHMAVVKDFLIQP